MLSRIILIILLSSCASIPKNTPKWTQESCTKDKDKYYFVGYSNESSIDKRIAQTIATAKTNALLCLFNGKINMENKISENLESLSVETKAEFKLKLDEINWKGFSVSSIQKSYLEDSHYFQLYEWDIKLLETERKRVFEIQTRKENINSLNNISKQTKALIEEEKRKLGILQKQNESLSKIKNSAQRAIATLSKLKRKRKTSDNEMYRLVKNMPCGISVKDLVGIFKKPDVITIEKDHYKYKNIFLKWDHWTILISTHDRNNKFRVGNYTTNQSYINYKEIAEHRPTFFYTNHAVNRRGYRVCEK